jgi:hypothetical protein
MLAKRVVVREVRDVLPWKRKKEPPKDHWDVISPLAAWDQVPS